MEHTVSSKTLIKASSTALLLAAITLMTVILPAEWVIHRNAVATVWNQVIRVAPRPPDRASVGHRSRDHRAVDELDICGSDQVTGR